MLKSKSTPKSLGQFFFFALLVYVLNSTLGCGWIVREDSEDFPSDGTLSGFGFYTAGQIDSNRLWHSTDEDLPVLLENVRTISPCALKDPNWVSQGNQGEWLIEWPFDGSLSVDCPLASAYWDTLVVFDQEAEWNSHDQMILYGYSILPSDTLDPDSAQGIEEPEKRIPVPIDTIQFALGTTTLDSFYMATDSFRQVIKKVGAEPFGIVKALFESKKEDLYYSETHYICPEESYEPCAEYGLEYDTLDTRIPLDTVGGRTGPDTLKRVVSAFCANGASLCDIAFRIDSVVVDWGMKNLDINTWHTFFYERTSECNEWNLYRLRSSRWLPSANGDRIKRNASFTLYRERFDREPGDRGCVATEKKNLWMSLDSLRPIFNTDTIAILDSIWSEQ